jgi:ATP-dependent Clp protease ATP-binding subunit ClpB
VMDALRGHFRPEFLNRIDETIIFDRLSQEQLKKIVDIQLQLVARRLAQQNLKLHLTEAAKKLVAEQGYDPVYGARPLKRAIQRLILDPLSLELLEGKFGVGDAIEADIAGESLTFRKI